MISETITQGWPVGAKFWYTSKYSDTLVEGVVGSYRKSTQNSDLFIKSTTGASYYSSEIEIEELSEIRAKKLDDLGI